MKKIYLIIITALLINLYFICSLFADTLTLKESIDKSISHHPDIKSFMLKIQQSEKNYKSSYADHLPQISLHGGYNPLQTFALPVNGTFNTIDDDSWSAGASLKQKIWDYSKTAYKVKASKVDEDVSRFSMNEAKALLAYKVKSIYGLMVVQKNAIDVREKDHQTKQAYYDQAKALVAQGLKTDADASRFLSAVYAAQNNLATAKASFEKAKASLSLYMGEQIEDDVDFEPLAMKKENSSSFEEVQKEILANNYQLKIESLNMEKSMLLHKSAKASRYGSIDLIADYTYQDTLNRYDSKFVGININIPLYSGGRMNADVEKMKLETQIAQEKKSSRILALKEELAALFIDIKKYDKTIASEKAQLRSATETKKVLEGRYKEGLATYIEILDATALVLNSELGVLEAYYSKNIAINRIEYLKGKT